jgi:drug/metabolite transporter (DMT)-like permease
MVDRVIAPIVIGIVLAVGALLTAALYYVALSYLPGGPILRVAVVAGGVAIIGAIAVVVRQRIKEENSDDYRNY